MSGYKSPIAPAQLSYNTFEGVIEFSSDITNVVAQLPLESWSRVYNDSGAQIDNGKAVYISGVHTDYTSKVELATNATESIANRTIGLATEDIPDGGYGFVTTRGDVRDFDTSGLSPFGASYLDTNGDMTPTKPSYPASVVIMGGVKKVDATTGIFQVGLSRVTQGILVTKSYSFTSNGVGAGTYYAAGYYDAPATDSNLNQGSTTQVLGTANGSYAAHPFIVCAAAGTVDTGIIGLRVNGTSITDAGVRTATDTDTILANITDVATDEYYEGKKFIGQVTYELFTVSGTPVNYSFDFNYGWAKYEDFGNHNFTLTGCESVGLSGATDANFDIIIYHHSNQGWTYSAAAFTAGGTRVTSLQSVHVTEYSTINGEPFAFKRIPITTVIDGADSEGVVIQIITGQNGTVQSMDTHLGVVFN